MPTKSCLQKTSYPVAAFAPKASRYQRLEPKFAQRPPTPQGTSPPLWGPISDAQTSTLGSHPRTAAVTLHPMSSVRSSQDELSRLGSDEYLVPTSYVLPSTGMELCAPGTTTWIYSWCETPRIGKPDAAAALEKSTRYFSNALSCASPWKECGSGPTRNGTCEHGTAGAPWWPLAVAAMRPALGPCWCTTLGPGTMPRLHSSWSMAKSTL
mmetsp:Transcript_18960/g.60149  ORF Transcript_18960/g.60149 Transcript_18960/m.60149 type:complete len:210 (+) Transcript_18960:572-1201(+)